MTVDALAKRGLDVTVTLTDRYPDAAAFEHLAAESSGRVSARTTPVDATAVPHDLRGFRTIWNAVHHVRPEEARRVFQEAVDQGQPIGVFEVVRPEVPMLLG